MLYVCVWIIFLVFCIFFYYNQHENMCGMIVVIWRKRAQSTFNVVIMSFFWWWPNDQNRSLCLSETNRENSSANLYRVAHLPICSYMNGILFRCNSMADFIQAAAPHHTTVHRPIETKIICKVIAFKVIFAKISLVQPLCHKNCSF